MPSDEGIALAVLQRCQYGWIAVLDDNELAALGSAGKSVMCVVLEQLQKAGLVARYKERHSTTREGLRVLAGLRPLALTTPALQEDALRRVRQILQDAQYLVFQQQGLTPFP